MSDRGRIFGTDGIRDRAGQGFLEPTEVVRIVNATTVGLAEKEAFAEDFPKGKCANDANRVIVGRDTRQSGEGLVETIAKTFVANGYGVTDVGVIPTPGVAYLASRSPDVSLGIMISASHNAAEYNGIKFLAATGAKVSEEFEERVSRAYWDGETAARGGVTGEVMKDPQAVDLYARYLVESAHRAEAFKNRRVVLDMANGATVDVAQRVFERLGSEVIGIANCPDGTNINDHCGALYPERLARRVVSENGSIGFAFDGDGDRMIPVTETGRVLDGDYVMAICGRYLRHRNRLSTDTVVATVMSNLGLEKTMEASGIKLLRTPVGDRHVYREMEIGGHAIGGEQSGHIIFFEDSSTGDGILSAIRLLDSLELNDGSLDHASRIMKRYPQILLNFEVSRKAPLEEMAAVQRKVRHAEDTLGDEGRVLLRYSGTEPVARVMIEGPDVDTIKRLAQEIGQCIVDSIDG